MKKVLLIMFCIFTVGACGEGGTRINIGIESFKFTEIGNALTSQPLLFGQVQMNVSELVINPLDCSLSAQTSIEGPFLVNVLTGTFDPKFSDVQVEPEPICGIGVSLVPASAGSDIEGNSIVMMGQTESGTNFEIYVDSTLTIDLINEDSSGIAIDSNQKNNFVIEFDINEIFKGIDESNVTIEDNKFRISSTENENVYGNVTVNLRNSARLLKDGVEVGQPFLLDLVMDTSIK